MPNTKVFYLGEQGGKYGFCCIFVLSLIHYYFFSLNLFSFKNIFLARKSLFMGYSEDVEKYFFVKMIFSHCGSKYIRIFANYLDRN